MQTRITLALAALVVAAPVLAQQQGYPPQDATYPQQPAYPQQPVQQPAYPPAQPQPAYPQPAYPQAAPAPGAYVPAAPPKSNPIRDLFAGTLSAILQAVGGSAVTTLTQALSGSITNWFARKTGQVAPQPYAQAPAAPGYYDPNTQSASPASAYPSAPSAYPPAYPNTQSAYPGTQSAYPPASTDPYAAAGAYPTSAYPQNTSAYSQDPYAAYAAQVYDPRTGQAVDASASQYSTASSGYDGTLYAGVAYEVHALGAGGAGVPVNAATHEFRSGDRFMVHFRPSMPGRMDVYNINPRGQQTRIDSVTMAAGQLTSLGPYEFAGTKGDEALRLVLTPCSTPQLLVASRDIVNVSQSYVPQTPAAGAVGLSSCNAPAMRAVGELRTRDIRKVAVDGTTSFALDPVSAAELSSGELTAREVTIYFHHR